MYAVIVDGYSSGASLVYELNKLGISCVHVQSATSIPDVYQKTFDSSAYICNIVYQNDIDSLLFKIRMFGPRFCIPGSEPGVELAELISAKLDLSMRNDFETSQYRRNKFFMQERIKECGLKSIAQFKTNSIDKALIWASKWGKWPLVIKPLKSAGGDKVKICSSNEEIISGFKEIINNKPNMLGELDNEILIQEYIEAPEFAINTVQFEGESYLCEIVQFHKLFIGGGRKIYDYASLIPFDKCNTKLVDYSFKVAKSLDIKFGPMHAEIFDSKEGPVLIEAAARLMGANVPINLMNECLSHPQAYMTVLQYVNPKEFINKFTHEVGKVKKHLRIIFLISTSEGNFVKINHLDIIRDLPSFFDIKIRIKDKVFVTTDYDTSPGLVYLCHDDEEVIERDYSIIRKLEKETMYEVN